MATRLTPDKAAYRAKKMGITVPRQDVETAEETWLRANEWFEARLIEAGYVMLGTPTLQWIYQGDDGSGPAYAALKAWVVPATWPYELTAILRNRIEQELEPVVVSDVTHFEHYDEEPPVEPVSSRLAFYAGWAALAALCFIIGALMCQVAIGS